MMLEEFEQRTGFYPTLVQYAAIERAYMDFDGDKDAFCKAYKKNADGIAERIQREVNLATIKQERDQATELARRDAEIERLKKELEREQEWKPYEDTHNITQAQYTDLAESVPSGAVHYMTDAEALDWICSEFGFDRSKVTILHEIDEYEVNRHHQLRRTGKKSTAAQSTAPRTTTTSGSMSGAAPAGCGKPGTASSAPSTIDTRPAPEVTRAESKRRHTE